MTLTTLKRAVLKMGGVAGVVLVLGSNEHVHTLIEQVPIAYKSIVTLIGSLCAIYGLLAGLINEKGKI